MKILKCTPNQLLILAGVNANTFRSDKLRGQAVACFGAPDIGPEPLAIDAVALLVRDTLNISGLPRMAAATVTRAFWDQWATAVSASEHGGENYLFALGQLVGGTWWASAGPAERLPRFLDTRPPCKQLHVVNLPAILFEIRKRAKAARLDLSKGHFFLPRNHPVFSELIDSWVEWRARALEKFDPLHLPKVPPLNPGMRNRFGDLPCVLIQ